MFPACLSCWLLRCGGILIRWSSQIITLDPHYGVIMNVPSFTWSATPTCQLVKMKRACFHQKRQSHKEHCTSKHSWQIWSQIITIRGTSMMWWHQVQYINYYLAQLLQEHGHSKLGSGSLLCPWATWFLSSSAQAPLGSLWQTSNDRLIACWLAMLKDLARRIQKQWIASRQSKVVLH